MNSTRLEGLLADIRESETEEEMRNLDLEGFGQDPQIVTAISEKMAQFSGEPEKQAQPEKKLRKKVDKKYRLLKTDVKWASQNQVQGLMSVISQMFKVGDVIPESKIVEALSTPEVEKNVLKTRQGGRRIWNYYKGDHFDGLLAHGNIEVVPESTEVGKSS